MQKRIVGLLSVLFMAVCIFSSSCGVSANRGTEGKVDSFLGSVFKTGAE